MALETLDQFRERTAFVHHSLPQAGFCLSGGLGAKIASHGSLRTFVGDTVIFDLDEETRAWLEDARQTLYAVCGAEMLSARLPQQSFHVTLHDLVCADAQHIEDALLGMEAREAHANEILAGFKADLPACIRLRATAAMNMVAASVVIAFEPASQADCAALMEMHARLQAVVPLDYPLTPHATLAYYRPALSEAARERLLCSLRLAFGRINEKIAGREITLSQAQLRYCCFADMGSFVSRQEMLRRLGRENG